MDKVKVVILNNESENSHVRWLSACDKLEDKVIGYVVDLTKNDWLDQISAIGPDILLTLPGGLSSPFKQLYDERLMILVKEIGYFAFPSLDEVLLYENKRYLSYWLKANELSHPQTDVFYNKDEAIDFLHKIGYPLIGKVNIGGSGSGVTFLNDFVHAREYVIKTFSGYGAQKRNGPNFQKGNLLSRGFQYIIHPYRIKGQFKKYKFLASDVQKDFVILQEFVPHEFEWRVVRMGDSFFAHKKLKKGDKASGSLLKNYDNPKLSVMDFVKEITDRFGFYSMAVDIFESDKGYLVNEMQCIFGQSDPYQMLVDGNPGRYLKKDGLWVFESGNFNTNESYDLRLKTAVELFQREKH